MPRALPTRGAPSTDGCTCGRWNAGSVTTRARAWSSSRPNRGRAGLRRSVPGASKVSHSPGAERPRRGAQRTVHRPPRLLTRPDLETRIEAPGKPPVELDAAEPDRAPLDLFELEGPRELRERRRLEPDLAVVAENEAGPRIPVRPPREVREPGAREDLGGILRIQSATPSRVPARSRPTRRRPSKIASNHASRHGPCSAERRAYRSAIRAHPWRRRSSAG